MAADLFTVYTYGAGKVLENTFNAIAAMYTGGFMAQFFNLSLMFGLMWAGIKAGITRDSTTHFAKWFAGYLFVILVLLQPINMFKNKGMTIHIRDVITGKPYKVDHLPPGLVIPAGIISGVGFEVTKLFETLFSSPKAMPEYLPYHKYGTVFGAQVASEMRNVTIQDPLFKENLEGYITNCMLYDVMIGKKYDIRDLNASKDIWTFLNEHSSNLRMFNYRKEKVTKEDKGGRELVACKVGLTRLAAGFNKESELLAKKFPRLAALAAPKGSTSVKRGFTEALKLAGNFYGNIDGSASNQLRQLLIINQFKDVPKSYGILKAQQNQNVVWNMLGSLGKISLPVMHAIFQALIYACFPIVITLLFFSQRYQSLKTYFELMVWLELWPLLFAILNGAVSVFAREAGINAEITIGNINNITTTQSTYAMMAYSMGLAVPSLAYMIAKGGVGQFVHMAGSLISSTQTGANVAATELTTGSRSLDNVNIGNSSYNNTNANKHDTSGSISTGFVRQTMPGGGNKTTHLFNEDGSGTVVDTTGSLHKVPINISTMRNLTNTMRDGVTNSEGLATREGEQATVSQQETKRQAVDFLARNAESIVKGEGRNINMSAQQRKSLTRMAKTTMDLQKRFGYSKEQAGQMALNAELQGNAGVEGKGGTPLQGIVGSGATVSGSVGIGGKVGTIGTLISKDMQDLTEGKSVAIGKDNQHVIDSMVNYGKNQKYDETQSQEKSASENLSHSYDEFKNHSKSAEFHKNKAKSFQKAFERIESTGLGINEDKTNEFVNYYAQKPAKNHNGLTGYDDAIWHINRGDDEFKEVLKDYVDMKNYTPDQRVIQTAIKKTRDDISSDNSNFGSDIKQKIESPNPTNDRLLKTREENIKKINTDTDGSKIKQQVEKKREENKKNIQLQNVDTRNQAKALKKEVDEKEEGGGFFSKLRKWGAIGTKNPYKKEEYDE